MQRPDREDEDPGERWDRNYSELLQELRVAQTGVQILFAFLLTIPFSTRWADVTDSFDHFVYVFTVITTGLSMALLVAPVSIHRQVFRKGRKPELVVTSSRLAFGGLAMMLLSVMGAIYLVLGVVAGAGWAGWLVGAVAAVYIFLWYVLPRLKVR